MRRLPLLAVGLALVACTHSSPKPAPTSITGVERFDGLAHTHVLTDVQYPQTPPAGGPHSQVWLRCGVYGEAIPNVNAVHSMEHGAVWITYRPDLSPADVDVVKKLQLLKPAFILISPFPGLTNPVVASAWGLQLKVDKVDDPRLAEFVKAYAGGTQGGEQGTRCDNGATLDQARAYDEKAAASAASASPTS
ncbi:MAG: hypothetical protein QOE45_1289 [Frankiaceae bacterium]|jgi:hypothetical protein|nr:hypothetical protein [Frankiaceae bacterium]